MGEEGGRGVVVATASTLPAFEGGGRTEAVASSCSIEGRGSSGSIS